MRLTPRGGRDAVDGWAIDGAGRPILKVRVAAPPVGGEANDALVALIAKALKRPRGAVSVAVGAGGRIKQLEIEGVSAAELARAFGAPPAKP